MALLDNQALMITLKTLILFITTVNELVPLSSPWIFSPQTSHSDCQPSSFITTIVYAIFESCSIWGLIRYSVPSLYMFLCLCAFHAQQLSSGVFVLQLLLDLSRPRSVVSQANASDVERLDEKLTTNIEGPAPSRIFVIFHVYFWLLSSTSSSAALNAALALFGQSLGLPPYGTDLVYLAIGGLGLIVYLAYRWRAEGAMSEVLTRPLAARDGWSDRIKQQILCLMLLHGVKYASRKALGLPPLLGWGSGIFDDNIFVQNNQKWISEWQDDWDWKRRLGLSVSIFGCAMPFLIGMGLFRKNRKA